MVPRVAFGLKGAVAAIAIVAGLIAGVVLYTASGTEPSPDSGVSQEKPKPRSEKPLPAKYTNAKLRKWIKQGRLPEAPAHGDVFLTMANALVRKGAPDVMIFGDSQAQQGFDPEVLSQLASERTGEPVRAFNVASSRARWGVNRMVARYAEKHHVLPKVAILVISTRSAEDDVFYRTDVRTQPFSSITESCANRTPERTRDCQRELTDLRFRFRGQEDLVRAAAGRTRWPASMAVSDNVRLRSDGLLAHPPVSVAEVQEDSEDRLEHPPGPPKMDDEARKMLRDTVGLLRRNGVKVVAVSLPYSPVHQRNLDARYPGYDDQRQQAAAALAASADVPFFQVESFGPWWGDGSSRDAIHLSEEGAGEFARQVWQMPGFADRVLDGLRAR